MNCSINLAWHTSNHPMALLRCYGSPGFFGSGLKLICVVGPGVSHLPLNNTLKIIRGSGQASWLASHAMVSKPITSCFGRYQVLLDKEISIWLKLVNKTDRWLCWLSALQSTVDQHQQMTWHPKASVAVKTSQWTCHSSSRLWDLGFQIKCKLLLSERFWTTDQWFYFLDSSVHVGSWCTSASVHTSWSSS